MRNPFLINNPEVRQVQSDVSRLCRPAWAPACMRACASCRRMSPAGCLTRIDSPCIPFTPPLLQAGFLYDSTINEHWTGDGLWPTSKDGGNR